MNFSIPPEVVAYVHEQLSRALAEPWTFERASGAPLQWRIFRPKDDGQDYLLEVSGDLRYFLIYWGNSSAGAFGLHHALLNASVIHAAMLERFPLAESVAHVIARREPNWWNLT